MASLMIQRAAGSSLCRSIHRTIHIPCSLDGGRSFQCAFSSLQSFPLSFPGTCSSSEMHRLGPPVRVRKCISIGHRERSAWCCHQASQDGNERCTDDIGEVTHISHRKTHLQVVLVSPQIPGNTGCIARSCAAAAVGLHLVEPMGFEINSAKLKRAGLDYWPYPILNFFLYFQQQEGHKRLLGFSKKGTLPHTEVKYRAGDWLLFGSETEGLPDTAIQECLDDGHGGGLVRIPIDETYVRCLNLSVAAGIGVYEALRQLGYAENMLGSSDRDSLPLIKEDMYC